MNDKKNLFYAPVTTVIQKLKRLFGHKKHLAHGTRTRGGCRLSLLGAAIGFLNGLLGSGGGMVAVPMLRGMKVAPEACHATSIAIIAPLAITSGFLYLNAGSFHPADALPYLPGGLLGAVFGAWILPKIKTIWLRRIFGAIILFAAWRLFTQ